MRSERPPIRLRGAAGREARGHARSALRIARNRTIDLPLVPAQLAVNQGDIPLAYGARSELLAQNAMRGVIARDDDRSRCASVQAMDDPGTKASADRGKRAKIMEQRVHQRAFRGSGARVHHHARRLIHHGHVFILVQHVQGDLLRSGSQRRSRQHLDVDHVAGHHPLRAPYQPAAQSNPPFVDQFLNARAADVGKTRGEIEVQAAAGIFRRRGKAAHNGLLLRGDFFPS